MIRSIALGVAAAFAFAAPSFAMGTTPAASSKDAAKPEKAEKAEKPAKAAKKAHKKHGKKAPKSAAKATVSKKNPAAK
jgi:hypothetical protein